MPFALWGAAQHLRNYEEALWLTVEEREERAAHVRPLRDHLVGAVELAAGALILDLRFPPPAFLPLAAFLLLAALVLLVLAPFVWGTTPGMALADLRICAEDGGSPTLSAALLRFVGFLVTFALAGVPLLVAAFDRRGRTLADLVSRTTIEPVEAAEPSSLS